MVGKGRWEVGACHEEGVAHPSFALPGEKKTSGETKLKGLKLQGRQFWLKIEKPRVGRRRLLQLPARHPVGVTWEQAEHRLFQHHPARRHRGVSPGTQMLCLWLIPLPASGCVTHSLFWLVG